LPASRSHDADLIARARRGELTRRTTEPGQPERRAVNRVEYVRRRALHFERSAREATGHYLTAPLPLQMSFLAAGPPRFIVVENLSRRDRSRAGRYADFVGKLDIGRLSPAEFGRRVSRWRPIAGERFLADPDAVLAILEQRRAQDVDVFVYQIGGTT
jgi:hypothetical protein